MTKTNWQKEVKEKWNENATFWNSKSQEMWENGSRQSIIPFLKKYVEPGAKILDLGCGDGYGSYKLWIEGYDVTGVDLSEEMIRFCQKRVTDDMKHLHFQQADMLDLPFDDHTFDTLMAINALEWAEVPIDAFNEVTRVVKPGGTLCVGILGPTAAPRVNSYNRLYGKDVIMNTMMPWEFQKLAEENTLKIVDCEKVYKRGVNLKHVGSLPEDLKQSLTFMTLFMLKK
ncbi:class I SAM-dependent methyltransferase [Piscibacillus halophilus]|uniref:Methyltransferase domain-containing protein n=1 Tax=Piscibacillus halophilus TaxID=571933 RepID=A0A1H9K882_9BACI|nr:class I SAM-dependent methyltransferase [Piscibacillus halophilus]SEQ95137.1 Methyltransferase domain-containing protein [Piscibacillus halophilus]